MPQTFAFIILAAQAGSLSGVLAGVGALFTGTALGQIALSVGLSYLSALIFKPQQPKPEDVQTSVKNPTAPRQRHYGRVKTSGPWVFAETEQGNLHKVIAIGTGEIDAIEEYWIDDKLVEIDVDGKVTTDPFVIDDQSRVVIETRLGLATETAYSNLTAKFSDWDSAHRGDGVASLYAKQLAVNQDRLSELFQNVSNTLYRLVIRGAKIYNPITALTAWTDNAAAVIRDYITHADGMRLPVALVNTPQAAAGMLTAANNCATAIPLKAGGTENRYRLWGTYAFNERPADVLGRMLTACDGRLVPTPDGGVTLSVGVYSAPTVTIDQDTIVGFSEVARGRDVLTTANIIRATYMSPFHDYQSTDADQWIDDDDVSARGEIATDTSYIMSPSHAQTRRLMKIAAYRANPSWVGSFQCNLRAMAAFGERFVRITYPLFDIDEVFEVTDFRFDVGDGGILIGVTLQVQSMPAAAYAWDAATEEGTEPVSEETVTDKTIPVPTGLSAAAQTFTVGGATANYAVLTFDASPSDALVLQARGRLTTDSAWSSIAVEPGATSATGFLLSDSGVYEFQLRFVTLTGRIGEWSASYNLTSLRSLDFSYPANSMYLGAI